MTITQYLAEKLQWLRLNRHPMTVNEIGRAVDEFCKWWGSDPDIESVTPELADEFEAGEDSQRRRQLASYLRSLLRQYNPKAFPHRNRGLHLRQRSEVEAETPKRSDGTTPTLVEFTRQYVSQRVICAGYADTLQKRAVKLQSWLGLSDIREVLTEANVNAFLVALGDSGSPYTRRKWRGDILTLWSAAADDDLCAYPNRRRIRREKVGAASIECYSPDEVRILVATAEKIRGAHPNGVPRRRYWPAIIRFAWDTGLRRGDCWRFERSMLQPDGTFRIIQNKTRKPIRRKLRPDTIAALDQLDSPTPLAWSMNNRSFTLAFRRIVLMSGLDKGMFKWLRRGCGSQVEAAHPGAGHKALGNTEQVFRTNYDAELAAEIHLPPQL